MYGLLFWTTGKADIKQVIMHELSVMRGTLQQEDQPGSGVRGSFSEQVTYKLSDKEDLVRPGGCAGVWTLSRNTWKILKSFKQGQRGSTVL